MIKLKTQKAIQKLAEKYRLKVVMLFGSAAKEKMRSKSDIDLAILADSDFFKKNFSNFNYDLMEVEKEEQREIEIVPISNQNPILLFNIFNDGVPIYIKNQEEYYRLRSWARFSYEDNLRFFFGREKLLKKRMEKLKV